MIRALRNLPIRYKLLASFGLIILINALFGFFSLRIMRQLGELVNVTYDRALMSGTFAQAAKFDFAVFDAQTRAALSTSDPQEFKSAAARSRKIFETLDEDLSVVAERALGDKSRELITELRPALNELQKSQQALLETKSANLQTQALEREWELAVKSSNMYRRLTGLYDDAAELGYRFRLESEEKNNRIIRQALVILGVSIAAGLFLSLLVAYVLILPIFRLTKVCRTVANGDYSVRATVEADDEIGKFATAFNGMLGTIQQKDESIAALLAALPFGLFYIDAEGRISRERSPATDQIFANFSTHLGVADFFRYYGLAADTTTDILASAFQRLLPFKSAVFLLPDTVSVDGGGTTKTVRLSYRPQFGPKKQLERIIVIAEDVTEKNQAIAERQRLSERV
ncbi:MAG: MCP four helix bundle domain-containing protein, partial [Bacteriovoracia bacterium]